MELGTFVALGVRGSGMIENCSFNLGEFYVKMGKTNRELWRYAMTHEMDIWHDSFVKIKEQTKTIEMRLFDEKRSLISTGDTIIFTDTSNKEKIDCMVINMYRYLSFEELYQHHSKVSIGYNKDEIANPKEMLMYYSKEMIEKYGVVAIEIKVL